MKTVFLIYNSGEKRSKQIITKLAKIWEEEPSFKKRLTLVHDKNATAGKTWKKWCIDNAMDCDVLVVFIGEKGLGSIQGYELEPCFHRKIPIVPCYLCDESKIPKNWQNYDEMLNNWIPIKIDGLGIKDAAMRILGQLVNGLDELELEAENSSDVAKGQDQQIDEAIRGPEDCWDSAFRILQLANLSWLQQDEFDMLKQKVKEITPNPSPKDRNLIDFIAYCGDEPHPGKTNNEKSAITAISLAKERLNELADEFCAGEKEHIIVAPGELASFLPDKGKYYVWQEHYGTCELNDFKVFEFRGITFLALDYLPPPDQKQTCDFLEAAVEYHERAGVSGNILAVVQHYGFIPMNSLKKTVPFLPSDLIEKYCSRRIDMIFHAKTPTQNIQFPSSSTAKNTRKTVQIGCDGLKFKFNLVELTLPRYDIGNADDTSSRVKMWSRAIIGCDVNVSAYDISEHSPYTDTYQSWRNGALIENWLEFPRALKKRLNDFREELARTDNIVSSLHYKAGMCEKDILAGLAKTLSDRYSCLVVDYSHVTFNNDVLPSILLPLREGLGKLMDDSKAAKIEIVDADIARVGRDVVAMKEALEKVIEIVRDNGTQKRVAVILAGWNKFTHYAEAGENLSRDQIMSHIASIFNQSGLDRLILVENILDLDDQDLAQKWRGTINYQGVLPCITLDPEQELQQVASRCLVRNPAKLGRALDRITGLFPEMLAQAICAPRCLSAYHSTGYVLTPDPVYYLLPQTEVWKSKNFLLKLRITDLLKNLYRLPMMRVPLAEIEKAVREGWSALFDDFSMRIEIGPDLWKPMLEKLKQEKEFIESLEELENQKLIRLEDEPQKCVVLSPLAFLWISESPLLAPFITEKNETV